MNKKKRLALRDEKRIKNGRLLRVFSGYLAQKSEYDKQQREIERKIEKATKVLRALNQEKDNLGRGPRWVHDLLEPIARVLADALETKTGIKRSWEILGPFGLSCTTSIHFFSPDSPSKPLPGGKRYTPTGFSITFRPGNTDVADRGILDFCYGTVACCRLYVVDYSKDLQHYAVGSVGQVNGLNHAQVAVKWDIEWLLGFVR